MACGELMAGNQASRAIPVSVEGVLEKHLPMMARSYGWLTRDLEWLGTARARGVSFSKHACRRGCSVPAAFPCQGVAFARSASRSGAATWAGFNGGPRVVGVIKLFPGGLMRGALYRVFVRWRP